MSAETLNDCPFCGVIPDLCIDDDTVCCPDGSCIAGQNFFSRKQWNARVEVKRGEILLPFDKECFHLTWEDNLNYDETFYQENYERLQKFVEYYESCKTIKTIKSPVREAQPSEISVSFDEWCASVKDCGHEVQPNSPTARQRKLGWDAAMATKREMGCLDDRIARVERLFRPEYNKHNISAGEFHMIRTVITKLSEIDAAAPAREEVSLSGADMRYAVDILVGAYRSAYYADPHVADSMDAAFDALLKKFRISKRIEGA